MSQGQRLNLKWSVADVDFVVGLSRARRTPAEIVERLKPRGIVATADEVRSLCFDAMRLPVSTFAKDGWRMKRAAIRGRQPSTSKERGS